VSLVTRRTISEGMGARLSECDESGPEVPEVPYSGVGRGAGTWCWSGGAVVSVPVAFGVGGDLVALLA
jgi:hypothetical protein